MHDHTSRAARQSSERCDVAHTPSTTVPVERSTPSGRPEGPSPHRDQARRGLLQRQIRVLAPFTQKNHQSFSTFAYDPSDLLLGAGAAQKPPCRAPRRATALRNTTPHRPSARGARTSRQRHQRRYHTLLGSFAEHLAGALATARRGEIACGSGDVESPGRRFDPFMADRVMFLFGRRPSTGASRALSGGAQSGRWRRVHRARVRAHVCPSRPSGRARC